MTDDDAAGRRSPRTSCSCGYAGLRPVVVHGGGPQITAQLDRLGIESEFAAGLRVTTPEAMDVVRMVLVGQVQREIVGLINAHGPFAVGLSGEDAHLFTAEPHHARGRRRARSTSAWSATSSRSTPASCRACSPTAASRSSPPSPAAPDGEVYNVNADTAAAALAVALGAEKLVVLTDVEGLYADWPRRRRPEPDDVISSITADDLEALLPSLSTGMVPEDGGLPARGARRRARRRT